MGDFYKAVVEQLRRHGYTYLRAGKSSHEIYSNGRRAQVVPFHMPSRHTANEIMKQAGIPHRFR